MNKYVKKAALMIPYVKGYYEEIIRYHLEIEHLYSEIENLCSTGIQYQSCWYIEALNIRFVGRIDTSSKCIGFCCEPHIKAPYITLCETPEESIMNFVKLRAEMIAESIRFSLLGRYAKDDDRKFTSECAKCPRFELNNWRAGEGLIHAINLSMYPSPCQCKCVYCNVPHDLSMRQLSAESLESYEKVFAIIDCAHKNGIIARDIIWGVSCGEITIHPFRDRILTLIKDQTASILTNCFIFDERIAANLSVNQQSFMQFSIDSGTPETWYKVKGVDNFKTVMENLTKYLSSGVRPEQIQLKYIVIPGINDNLEDFRSFIGIVKNLKINLLDISADINTRQRESLIRPAGYFLAMLRKNDIEPSFNIHFFPDEIEKINTLADELLETGEI